MRSMAPEVVLASPPARVRQWLAADVWQWSSPPFQTYVEGATAVEIRRTLSRSSSMRPGASAGPIEITTIEASIDSRRPTTRSPSDNSNFQWPVPLRMDAPGCRSNEILPTRSSGNSNGPAKSGDCQRIVGLAPSPAGRDSTSRPAIVPPGRLSTAVGPSPSAARAKRALPARRATATSVPHTMPAHSGLRQRNRRKHKKRGMRDSWQERPATQRS